MDTVTMNRRSMLGTVGISALAFSTWPGLLLAGERRRVERIGVQLYTVRDLLAADPPGTLEAVAGMGYVGGDGGTRATPRHSPLRSKMPG
jgi:hypothetical protein